MMDEIIFKCSKEFDLFFKCCHLDSLIRGEGVLEHYESNTTLGESPNM